MAPNSPACSFIHASMAGSRSTAPLNRSNSVLIIAPLSSFEISAYTAPLHEERKDAVGLRIATGSSATRELELRGDIPGSRMRSWSTTPLPLNPNGCAPLLTARGSECRFRRRGCGGPGISRQFQAAFSVALGLAAPRIRGRSRWGQPSLLWFRTRRGRRRERYFAVAYRELLRTAI